MPAHCHDRTAERSGSRIAIIGGIAQPGGAAAGRAGRARRRQGQAMTNGRAELPKAAEALMEAIAQEGRARQRKAEALLKALAADEPKPTKKSIKGVYSSVDAPPGASGF
jgi:hypothetical protein